MEHDWFKFDRDKEEIIVDQAGKERLVITKKDLEVSAFSGGPGGQNVNRSMNGVRLIYRIPNTHLLTFRKTRELIARSMNQRSKEQNYKDALETLSHKLERYFYVQPDRKTTKVPKRSKKKRMEGKKRRGKLKEDRKKVDF